MVKISINIEGENLTEIIGELLNIGVDILKSNRKEVKEAMKILADDALDVLMDRKTVEKGAQLYKKIKRK